MPYSTRGAYFILSGESHPSFVNPTMPNFTFFTPEEIDYLLDQMPAFRAMKDDHSTENNVHDGTTGYTLTNYSLFRFEIAQELIARAPNIYSIHSGLRDPKARYRLLTLDSVSFGHWSSSMNLISLTASA